MIFFLECLSLRSSYFRNPGLVWYAERCLEHLLSRWLQGCFSTKQEYCAVKKLLTSTVFFLFCYGVANAEEISLTTNDIDTLINGKTINGVHYGKKTIQYFSKSGLTLWIGQGDEQPTEGQWKVENDQYCSKFGSDWACFDIVFDKAQNIHYFIGEGFRAPFVVAQEFSLNF